ncbi:MAG TPA: hypothetical protein VGO03_04100 [Acidimicrobiia bacterium]|jgi:hypothetical protein
MTLEAYRVDNAVAVDDAAALEAWSRAARPVLTQLSKRYGALTAPDDLAESMQVLSGIRTHEAAELWISDVLDAVDHECFARQEPLLSAFCVGEDGRVGERYATRAATLSPTAITDIEMHAATQRLEAHRYHGAVLPVDGGRPALPKQLATVRASAAKASTTRTRASGTATAAPRKRTAAPRAPKKPDPPKRPVCPTCFLQLPLTGRCDNCDPE